MGLLAMLRNPTPVPMYRALPEAPADRTRVTVTVPLAGNLVTVTCGGEDVLHRPAGARMLALTEPLSSVTLEYLAATGVWYAVDGDLPPEYDAPASRSELAAVLGEILDDYHSGSGEFGLGGRSMAPETLALIITQRLRKKRAMRP
jgi:hypothetical protein